MDQASPADTHVYRTRLDRSGRITLPHAVREGLHIGLGDEILIVQSRAGLRIETPAQALTAAQDYFCSLFPPGASAADELIAERQEEAARDEREAAAWKNANLKRPRE